MATSIYNSKKFNLVPPKTKEEEIIVEERDNSLYYSFLLIFFGLVIFFVITLADVLVVTPRSLTLKNAIKESEEQISTYESIKSIHGELFVKSRALEPILDKDIKLTHLIDVSLDLIEDLERAHIVSYSREQSGEFALSVRLSNFDDIEGLVSNSEQVESLEDLFIKSYTKVSPDNEDPYYVANITFNLNNIPTIDV